MDQTSFFSFSDSYTISFFFALIHVSFMLYTHPPPLLRIPLLFMHYAYLSFLRYNHIFVNYALHSFIVHARSHILHLIHCTYFSFMRCTNISFMLRTHFSFICCIHLLFMYQLLSPEHSRPVNLIRRAHSTLFRKTLFMHRTYLLFHGLMLPSLSPFVFIYQVDLLANS